MGDTSLIIQEKCFHCGNDINNDRLTYNGLSFCCQGCASVYAVLKKYGMTDYYHYKRGTSKRIKQELEPQYDFLEDESIKNSLLEFKSNNLEQLRLYIPQIHCTACVWLLEKLNKLSSGIKRSEVDFLRKELFIAYNPQEIHLKEVISLISRLGYEPSLSLEDIQKKDGRKEPSYELWYKIGVVGFCFGNIMLLSFPEYLGIDAKKETQFTLFFGILNIVLSLPVLFYGARDYVFKAFQSIKQKQITLDVPLALGILALFIESVYEIFSRTGAGYLDSLAGLVFFLLLGKIFQNVSYSKLRFDRDYTSYFPISCTLIVDNGKTQPVPIQKLVKGQEIIVRNNELIPCDGILIKGKAIVDYSFVTGESIPTEIQKGEKLYAGGRQVGEAIVIKVIKPIEQSYFTKLWNSDIFKKQEKSLNFQSLVNKRSKYFTIAVIGIALLAGVYWWLTSTLGYAIQIFATVLIITCPCALALSSPFTLGNVMRILGANGFYVKNSWVIEKIAQIDTILFDKTGTLTVVGRENVTYEGKSLKQHDYDAIGSILKNSMHPLSQAILKKLPIFNQLAIQFFEEKQGKGLYAKINDQIWKIGNRIWVGKALDNNVEKCGTTVYVSKNEIIIGKFIISNHYHEQLKTVFKNLKKEGIQLGVISGDNDREFTNLSNLLGEEAFLKFNQKPEDKLQFISNLSADGKKVMMVGDGLNDAGALKAAFVGIAISNESLQFTPSSDGILESKGINKLDLIMKLCKKSIRVIKTSFVISLLYNVIGVSYAIQGKLTPLFAAIMMPLSSVTIIAFTTLASRYLARKLNLINNGNSVSINRN